MGGIDLIDANCYIKDQRVLFGYSRTNLSGQHQASKMLPCGLNFSLTCWAPGTDLNTTRIEVPYIQTNQWQGNTFRCSMRVMVP